MKGQKKAKAHISYFRYVLKHKVFVLIECLKLDIPWQGLVHDNSKFSRKEWIGYLLKFTLGEKSNEADRKFAEAWIHHQNCNPHHWQYWVQVEIKEGNKIIRPLEMPDRFIKEMLADWRAMSKAFGQKNIREWYQTNYSRMDLHPNTKAKLYALMRKEELPSFDR